MVDGQNHSRARRTKAQAERLRSKLLLAHEEGLRFSPRTGEPEDWAPSPADQSVYDWARTWVAGEWVDWAPRTRDSELEGLGRFLPLLVDDAAPAPPDGIRKYLQSSLRPDYAVDDATDDLSEAWLRQWVLPLGQLDEAILAEADRRLGLRLDGGALASNTSTRYRRTARTCIRRAVELKQIPADPWPPTPKGRSKRKARRQSKAIDVERLPDPATMAALIGAMANHQPASRMYQTMTAVGYYAGLRPPETIMLRSSAIDLPTEGWGRIKVLEADDGYDEPADPKTGKRPVPIPPQLVTHLATWLDIVQRKPDELIFRTRGDKRPGLSNWNRALGIAARRVGHRPISAYDCRHTCATTWLRAGVPLGEAALRLGHGVETLVAYYVGALQGDDEVANRRISAALDSL